MRSFVTMVGLAVAAVACSDVTGGMLVDAGTMIQDGSVPDAGAQSGGWDSFEAECNKSRARESSPNIIEYWAEFPIEAPGQTEVTSCFRNSADFWSNGLTTCGRYKATWIHGTNTGVTACGYVAKDDNGQVAADTRPDVVSITVHDPA